MSEKYKITIDTDVIIKSVPIRSVMYINKNLYDTIKKCKGTFDIAEHCPIDVEPNTFEKMIGHKLSLTILFGSKEDLLKFKLKSR